LDAGAIGSVDCYLPINRFLGTEHYPRFSLRPYQELLGKDIRVHGDRAVKPLARFELVRPTKRLRTWIDRARMDPIIRLSGPPFDQILHINFSAEYPGDDVLVRTWKLDRHDNINAASLWYSELLHRSKAELFALQVAIDLAEPGSALRGTALVVSAFGKEPIELRNCDLGGCYDEAVNLGFSPSPGFPVIEVWNWLRKQNGFRTGVADTSVAKALAAFTYIYHEGGEHGRFAPIVWVCAGLESFFGADPSSRARQLAEKLPLFLGGEPALYDAQLRHLYKTRSTFLHGEKAILSAVSEEDGPDKHFYEEWSAKAFGTYCLSETIRACIRSGQKSADFRLTLVNPSPRPSSAPR
jgi:hypothetical protein